MKPKTLLMLEAGIGVAAVSLTLALNSSNAAAEATTPAPEKRAIEAAASNNPPVAPAGQPAETPPAVPALVPSPLVLSPGMDEVVQLARSGVGEDVLAAFIEKSGKAYHPTAEEIIYLKDLGVAPTAIAKLIRTGNRDSELAKQVEAGKFDAVEATEPGTANPATNTKVVEAGGKTTVHVTAHNYYAAAPQPLESATAPAAVPAEPETTVDLNYFKTSLSPYGTWVHVDGIGESWRPTVGIVSSDWRPYYDGGRWIYSNSGWYWLSDYSWGWAPFHYGRWHRHSNWGWVWTPSYTWGPAWVEWRSTSDYYGWAPLPPHYGTGFGVSHWGGSFGFSISWGFYNWLPSRYCQGYYPRHYAHHGHGRGQEYYNNSTVIRPTINVNGNNNTVIVNGPDATVVANAARTEIKRVDIRDVGNRPGTGPREYLDNGGRTLAAFRPTVRPERGNAPETILANERAEFRRPATVIRAGGAISAASENSARSADSRNIILRGNPTTSVATRSTETVRGGKSSRASETETAPRIGGQNTTINPRPEYRRPATEPTPILRDGRTITVNRPTTVGETVVGGGARAEIARPARNWNDAPGVSLNSAPRQTVKTPDRSYSPPTASDAPRVAPARRSFEDGAPATTRPGGFRSESMRESRPVIAPSANPSRVESPGTRGPMMSASPSRSEAGGSRGPAMSAPVVASSARPSYSPPASAPAPTFSRPSAPEPSRNFSSPPPSAAPSRSAESPANSGGGGNRGGGPRREN